MDNAGQETGSSPYSSAAPPGGATFGRLLIISLAPNLTIDANAAPTNLYEARADLRTEIHQREGTVAIGYGKLGLRHLLIRPAPQTIL